MLLFAVAENSPDSNTATFHGAEPAAAEHKSATLSTQAEDLRDPLIDAERIRENDEGKDKMGETEETQNQNDEKAGKEGGVKVAAEKVAAPATEEELEKIVQDVEENEMNSSKNKKGEEKLPAAELNGDVIGVPDAKKLEKGTKGYKKSIAATLKTEAEKKRKPQENRPDQTEADAEKDTRDQVIVKIANKETGKVLATSVRKADKDPFVRLAPQDPHIDKTLAKERRMRVKTAMKRAWNAYHAHAWGKDTILPISLTSANRWGGMAMTMLDSLSTLWVMGLKEEFEQARDWIAENLSFKSVGHISVFETNIRALGGLLSAFDLSRDKVFLEKAAELADMLLPAFDSPTGFPINGLILSAGLPSGSHQACLAEFGTVQLEFRYLSHATGNPIYAKKAMHVYERMHEESADVAEKGLFRLDFNSDTGAWGGKHYSVGARGDSFYEYLLKTWLQGNKKETWLREMFDESVDGAEELLIARGPGGRLYIANNDNGMQAKRMEHLACFYPGTLALGAATLETKGDAVLEKRATHYMDLARELGETCYQFAGSQMTGLAPDSVVFDQDGVPQASDPRYILRPEVAESMYYLHLLDGDPKWREYGAKLFEAIDFYCRTNEAYAQVRLSSGPSGRRSVALRGAERKPSDVGGEGASQAEQSGKAKDMGLVTQEDDMESFFLAETLKYLYLIQETEPGEVDLSRQVFNTEAHPLHIFDE